MTETAAGFLLHGIPAGDAVRPLLEADRMDEDGFTQLYLATAPALLRYLAGVSGRRDVAEDLVQECFCRYLARRPRLADPSDARPYLFRIATNLLRDRWRRGVDAAAPEVEEAAFLPETELQMDVRRAMQHLKPRERELLWLAYVEGWNHKEIAAATGLATLSVRLLLFRARASAAQLLKPAREGA